MMRADTMDVLKKVSCFLTAPRLLTLLLVQHLASAAWYDDSPSKRTHILGDNEVTRFQGNRSYKDHFKLLERDGESLLIGARNIVYNLSLHDLTPNSKFEWYSSQDDVALCSVKGKSDEDCQNYIRVLVKQDENRLLICGTNAYKPECRVYSEEMGVYKVKESRNARGLCPFGPKDNSTAVYADGELYAATFADFQGGDALIFRENLRTLQYDLKYLNAPNFVSSMEYKEYVLFFFRETAVEYINCGKAVYSRVARVCKQDQGGPKNLRVHWTSFLKSRLNCSIPGEFPFHFNEIQSTSSIITGEYGDTREDIIYGVFTTPVNSISGSAVCAFRMQQILDTFEGPFKEQETMNSNWLPTLQSKVPEPRPGQCVNNSRTLTDVTLNFVRTHSLMDEAVPAFLGAPLLVKASLRYRFTVIAVDPQIRGTDGKPYDVLFIGTDNGRILKMVNSAHYETEPTLIEDLQLMPPHVAITNIQIVRDSDNLDSLEIVVVTDDEVSAIKAQRCFQNAKTCSACVGLQDPYCAWDEHANECVAVGSARHTPKPGLLQSIATGEHAQCPRDEAYARSWRSGLESSKLDEEKNPSFAGKPELSDGHRLPNSIPPYMEGYSHEAPVTSSSKEISQTFTAQTFWLALIIGVALGLLLGFISGWLVSKRCQKDEYYGEAGFHEPSLMTAGSDTGIFTGQANNKTNYLNTPKTENNKNANFMIESKNKVKKIYL